MSTRHRFGKFEMARVLSSGGTDRLWVKTKWLKPNSHEQNLRPSKVYDGPGIWATIK